MLISPKFSSICVSVVVCVSVGFIFIPLRKINNLSLNNGGFVCDIKINNGIEILCRNNFNNFFQFKFDENLIFQKLTEQEKIILNVLKDLN